MTSRRRWSATATVLAAFLAWSGNAMATDWVMKPDARVRGMNDRMVALINEAAARSETFRGLVARINATDGIVYVGEGTCGHGVRACLVLTMTAMGENRVLWINVDPRRADGDLMGAIGHELQHAVEVLSNRYVRSSSAMILLFKKTCDDCGRRFETDAAIAVGVAVRHELSKSAPSD